MKTISKLSRIEIYLIVIGAIIITLGSITIMYTLITLYKDLPVSKYGMVVGISISALLLYVGCVLFRFRQRDTGHMIYENEVMEK